MINSDGLLLIEQSMIVNNPNYHCTENTSYSAIPTVAVAEPENSL
jgi:hypothetical protein